jgi:hypothetical protein
MSNQRHTQGIKVKYKFIKAHQNEFTVLPCAGHSTFVAAVIMSGYVIRYPIGIGRISGCSG